MKSLCILFLILVVMSSVVFAQTPQALKFDEFKDLQESELRQRLDRFAEMQISIPKSSLHVIVYAQIGTERTSIDILKSQISGYLKTKLIDSFSVNSGGFRTSQTTELWIVPDKADFPTAKPDEKFKPEKIAEFGKLNDSELEERLNEFFIKLYKEQTATGYIINYGRASDVSKRERKIRDTFRLRHYDSFRIVIVNGGEEKELKTVLWIVPQGAEPPTP